ncbi:T9SS type A sorting domain-containing protein [Mongoliitalea daihaiensis]|uniref:T9SS type A sorting domain-containing protein n=1 Tax=Mongoliitalea daihaiensis TaxID=2782006 RepID=UPI001F1F8B10|nr:T9SS type A sorting domain-containing protein [Mongoliitalea daihaiensis]UJP64906.1 T9SS type A sorting domain-containing protein [Mongoliitalea daihaiensis]
MGSIQRFRGQLDDLRLYGKALTSQDVLTLSNILSIPSPLPVESSLFTDQQQPIIGLRDMEIRLFPNPTESDLNVFFSNWGDKQVILELYDMKGIKLSEYYSSNQNLIRLDLSSLNLSSGVYLLYVDHNGSKSVHRFIKQ